MADRSLTILEVTHAGHHAGSTFLQRVREHREVGEFSGLDARHRPRKYDQLSHFGQSCDP